MKVEKNYLKEKVITLKILTGLIDVLLEELLMSGKRIIKNITNI